ncbi:hypothetical protein K4A83_05440 [Spirulina subsalsa FACHB-351]|uniref:O-antigen polymerase n=1 Tax=Spirulina subsalsa FACHB-351 TaxID=234711 RepID=A0ABT3L2I2_9CYAN|nr:hypothetical protein [Spirulina subsalsa]MCW6035716.1 hypothetical protein [Spirulina subsalsa FACHB-351]
MKKAQWLIIILSLALLILAVFQPSFAILGGLVLVCILSFQYPRTAFILLLIYLPFAGTITYQVLSGNVGSTFLKDFLYFPALIGLINVHRKETNPVSIPKPLRWSITILFCFSLLTLITVNLAQQILPGDQDGIPILMGLIGLKTWIGYIPLIGVGSLLLRQVKDLHFFSRLFVILALICSGLAIIQYGLLTTGICEGTRGLVGQDLFKATLEAKCFVGGTVAFNPEHNIIRLPGTFTSPWHWSWFLISSAFMVAASAWCDPNKYWKKISFLTLTFLTLSSIISGQDLAIKLVPTISILSYFVVHPDWKQNPKNVQGFGIFAVVFIVVSSIILSTEFVTDQFNWVLTQNPGFLGNGLGSATNAARIFGPTELMETFYPKILFEVGVLGLLSFLGVVVTLSWVVFQQG